MEKFKNTKTSLSYLIVTLLTWAFAKVIEVSDKYHILDYDRDVFIVNILFVFVAIFLYFTIINFFRGK